MPEYTAHSRLLDVLMADETFFDRLASAIPDYVRFAKVLIREDVAGQLAIADVANMAGAPVGDVVTIACGRSPASYCARGRPPALPVGRPAWPDLDRADACRFDARPLLESGHEPLPALLAFAEASPAGRAFAIDTTFHPQPLRRLFQGRGHETAAEPLGDNHWRTYVRQTPAT